MLKAIYCYFFQDEDLGQTLLLLRQSQSFIPYAEGGHLPRDWSYATVWAIAGADNQVRSQYFPFLSQDNLLLFLLLTTLRNLYELLSSRCPPRKTNGTSC